MLTEDGKKLAANVECRRAIDHKAEQLHQLARILKHHVKSMTVVLDNGSKVAFGQDMIDLVGLACLHLSQIWKSQIQENSDANSR